MPPAAAAVPLAAGVAGPVLPASAVGLASVLPSAATMATYATIGAAGVGAYSSIQQGRIAEQQSKFQAGLYGQEAESIDKATEFEEREMRVEGRKLRARQLLQSGGTVPGTGTNLLVGIDTAKDVEKDIHTMKYGYGLQRRQAYSQAALARMSGKSQKRASRWNAGSSLLTGAYNVGSIYT